MLSLPSTKSSDYAMHDWNVFPSHVVYHHLADLRFHASVPQEEEIAPLEGGFHAAGEDDDDGGGGVGEDGEAL